MNLKINVVSFNVPYPADYGGVMDVFYKLKALKKEGVEIHLHCFEYGRGERKELEPFCASVHYYKRKNSFEGNFSLLPYIVYSRNSEELTKSLLANDYPILFEGLHSCYLLNDERFAGRFKMYRESNIEHHYYLNLAADERNLFRKFYFYIEALRLKLFERRLLNADLALVVSLSDLNYLKENYPALSSEYLPSFHPNESVATFGVKKNYALYHGNLGVGENALAAELLIQQMANTSDYELVIAGKDPSSSLKARCAAHSNIRLVENPSDDEMMQWIGEAKVNVLYTEKPAGLKLKLLNILYNGGHCLVNPAIVHGTGLESACNVAELNQFPLCIKQMMGEEPEPGLMETRKKLLYENYSNERNAKKLIAYLSRYT